MDHDTVFLLSLLANAMFAAHFFDKFVNPNGHGNVAKD